MNAAVMKCVLASSAALLAGCMNMSGLEGNSRYACNAPEGVACDSVSGTYANALHRNLPSQRAGEPGPHQGTTPATAFGQKDGGAAPARPVLLGIAPPTIDPAADARRESDLRSVPRILRLWTKPWEDADGDLWDQGYVYVQVDNGRWQLDHVQRRIRDRFVPLQPPTAASPQPDTAPAGTALPGDAAQSIPSRSPPAAPGTTGSFGGFPTPAAATGRTVLPGMRQP